MTKQEYKLQKQLISIQYFLAAVTISKYKK